MKRNIYLDMVDDDKARELFFENLNINNQTITVSIDDALEKITAKPVYAKLSNPTYNSSAMDGIAVRSDDTKGATERSPITLSTDQYEYVNTGNPLQKGYDAVIMIENVEEVEDGLLIRESAPVFNDIRTVGEDIVYGEMLLPSNHKIRPFDIGALAAGGITQIEVYKKPTVTIMPTGGEIIKEGSTPKRGQIIDSNSWIIKSRLKEIGADPVVTPVIKDDPESIKHQIQEYIESSDMIVIIAGSSAGSKDYTRSVIEDLGEIYVHGIAIKPGKPTILGSIEGVPVIGLPGYPVSCWISMENYVLPVLQKYYKSIEPKDYEKITAKAGKRMMSSLRYKEYVRVTLGLVNNNLIASPLDRGAGSTKSLIRADGLAIIPTEKEGIQWGEEIEVQLLRPLSEIENTLVITGSHDPIIDEIMDITRTVDSPYQVSSSHVGSLAGLMSLLKEESHMAPIHLMDEETGQYNNSYVKDLFDQPMAIISGVGRTQGLIVKKGNPLDINSIEDIVDKKFVNRQRGSGTRIFTDYLLKTKGISAEDIQGYQMEKTTHMDIAATVKEDADVGIGVYSAAKALDLDFIPMGDEEYEFCIYERDLKNPEIQEFIKVLTSEEFKTRAEKLGGYSTKHTGKIRYINM